MRQVNLPDAYQMSRTLLCVDTYQMSRVLDHKFRVAIRSKSLQRYLDAHTRTR
jgi:hypothetical protein